MDQPVRYCFSSCRDLSAGHVKDAATAKRIDYQFLVPVSMERVLEVSQSNAGRFEGCEVKNHEDMEEFVLCRRVREM